MVSVEDNPPSLVVIVRRCLNTRFRPKRAKNAPCKKSNYVQASSHCLSCVGSIRTILIHSEKRLLRYYWKDQIYQSVWILLHLPLLQIDLPLLKSETPVQLCLAASHPLPRVLTGKTIECEFSRGWSAQKCIFLIGTLFKFCQKHSRNRCQISFMAPAINPALFSRPNHLRWGQIGRQPPIKAFRLIWSWCGVLRGRKLTHLRLKQVRRLSSINT